jgi:hypothetical protein
MSDNVVVEVLAAHADHLMDDGPESENYLNLFPAYRAELTPLLGIAERVKAALVPVTPSPAFEAGLKQDLLEAAIQRAEEKEEKFQWRASSLLCCCDSELRPAHSKSTLISQGTTQHGRPLILGQFFGFFAVQM